MVRLNEADHWRYAGRLDQHATLGVQELRISPSSAFKRPEVAKQCFQESTSCQTPLPLWNINNSRPPEAIHLHHYLESSDWEALARKLKELEGRNDSAECELVFSEENDAMESPLHTAAWKCPDNLMMQMLELSPPDLRNTLLLRRDKMGNTVLHLCCANIDETVEFTVVKNVLLLAPEALEMVNLKGDTPLHLLVNSPGFKKSHDFSVELAAEEAIASLLSLAQENGTHQNKMGLTLLHCAIANGAHERVLVQLLDLAPEAASIADAQGMLPLHYTAAFGGTPWTFVQQLIEVFPAALLAPTLQGDTPLHILVANAQKQLNDDGLMNRNTSKIAELLVSTPNGQLCPLLMPNKQRFFPLHCCAIFEAPLQLTRILMGSPHASAASIIPTHSGWTALHLACTIASDKASVENAKILCTQRACTIFDASDRTPIMLLLEDSPVSSHLFKFLLNECPQSAALSTKKGYLPLHLALEHGVKGSIVRRLVNVDRETLSMTNYKGDTALHIACRRGLSARTIRFLVANYKEARYIKNRNGHYPRDLAAKKGLGGISCLNGLPTGDVGELGGGTGATTVSSRSSEEMVHEDHHSGIFSKESLA